jgi:hypothetical protein
VLTAAGTAEVDGVLPMLPPPSIRLAPFTNLIAQGAQRHT